jgi:hypothetical protein
MYAKNAILHTKTGKQRKNASIGAGNTIAAMLK